MPKAKGKNGTGEEAPAKKPACGNKKNLLRNMPEKVPKGTIIENARGDQWCIGDSIGIGGFGEIYAASKPGENKYNYVVKCEPAENGPLFVEMHFYVRCGKLEDIKSFQKKKGLKGLGMPHMLGHGSFLVNDIKHRFVVMPRYGKDFSKLLEEAGNRFPEPTVYRLALQMLDVYEYIHSNGYVHGDLKGANILLGLEKADQDQAYLVDFGLITKTFKGEIYTPDPKKMHNGTPQYTSRDAHYGVPTKRSDLEILAYNLIEWVGGTLPWVDEKIINVPLKVQKLKESFFLNLDKSLKDALPKGVPSPIEAYFKYIAKMDFKDVPDYNYCRKVFESDLKKLNATNSGPFQFKADDKPSTSENAKAVRNGPGRKRKNESADPVQVASEDDDDDVVFEKTPKRQTPKKLKTVAVKKKTPVDDGEKPSGRKRRGETAKNKDDSANTRNAPLARRNKESPLKNIAKQTSPRTRANRSNISVPETPSPRIKRMGATLGSAKKAASTPLSATRSTPLKTSINFSPSISIQPSSTQPRFGKTIVNDNLTPNPKAKKTYELNLDLDISMDANVVINVNRKKKPKVSGSLIQSQENSDSPATSVRIRKLANDDSSSSSRSPTFMLKKSKRFESPR